MDIGCVVCDEIIDGVGVDTCALVGAGEGRTNSFGEGMKNCGGMLLVVVGIEGVSIGIETLAIEFGSAISLGSGN